MLGKRAALVAGTALLGAVAWLPMTSAALHAAVRWTTPPSLSMPVPAYFYWRDFRAHPAIKRWLPPCAFGSGLVSLALPGLALCAPMRRRLRPGKPGDPVPAPERALSDAHGSATWMTPTEARRWFPGGASYGGVVVGQVGSAGDAPLLVDPCDSDATHGLVFAGSGGGKTAGVTIPTLDPTVGWRGSVVVFDPSCEVGPKTNGMRIAAGQRVVTLAPGGQGMNVLDWIDPGDPLAEAHVHTVIETIGPDREAASGDNAIFIIQGKNLQVCLLADMLWTADVRRGDEPEHERTLRRFAHRMSTPEAEMKALLQDIHDASRSAMAKRLAGTLMGIHPKTFSSIYANAQADIAWLHTAAHAAVVSGSDLRTDALADGRTTVYVQIPLATLQDTPALGRTVVNALLQGVYRRNGRTAGRVLFLLDEVNLLGEMKALAIARDNARKYGVTLVPMWQSLGQLAGTWKDGGKSAWMESSSWQMFAAVNHEHTAKEVSERCGTYTVLARTENTSRGSSGAKGGGSSRNQGAGMSEQPRALIRPEEIQTRMGRDERIVFRRGGSGPLRCNAALWFKRPEMAARIGS